MRLLELVEAAGGGVGRHVVDLTEGLLRRGHEVHLLYSDVRSDRVFADDLHRLSRFAAFRSGRVSMQRAPGLSDVPAVRFVRRYLRRFGPFHILHSHSTKAGFVARLGLVGHSVKRLYTPHGFFSMDPTRSPVGRRVANLLEAGLSRLCQGVIVVSSVEHRHALELGVVPNRLCLIPNGVALDGKEERSDYGALRREWGIRDSEVCVGFVGRLVPVKSPETMLRSFARLPHEIHARARLVIVGDGPLAKELRRLAVALGLNARVVWLGEQDAKRIMHAFDVLALTSDAEAGGLVVLEALARGLPIIATSVGGIAETVRHGVNGFVTPVRGVAEIAAALDTLIRDADLRERMGRASRIIAQDFSVDRMVERTLAFYDQVVSGAWSGRAARDYEIASLP
jgi:glycosyltransferase involved in cell wall biosynthesis